MLRASRVVDFTPGNGSLALQCILFRIPVVLIVKNALHKEVLKRGLVEQLSACTRDHMDARFYDAAYTPLSFQKTEDHASAKPSEPKAKRSRNDRG